MKAPRWSRRVMARVVLAFALGAACNILGAAWCVWKVAARPHSMPSGWSIQGGHPLLATIDGRPGKTMVAWDPMPADWKGAGVVYDPTCRANPPAWAELSDEMAALVDKDEVRRVEIAYGWPCLSFRGGVTFRSGREAEHDFGNEVVAPIFNNQSPPMELRLRRGDREVRGTFSTFNIEERTVPTAPVFRGVLINTLAYTAPWSLALVIPRVTRRWMRCRRGACIECGYSRSGIDVGAACPECGASARGQPGKAQRASTMA